MRLILKLIAAPFVVLLTVLVAVLLFLFSLSSFLLTAASVIMALAAWAGHGLFDKALRSMDFLWKTSADTGELYFSFTGSAVATAGGILVGVVVYVLFVLLLRVLSREDLELMPKGEKIAKILRIK